MYGTSRRDFSLEQVGVIVPPLQPISLQNLPTPPTVNPIDGLAGWADTPYVRSALGMKPKDKVDWHGPSKPVGAGKE